MLLLTVLPIQWERMGLEKECSDAGSKLLLRCSRDLFGQRERDLRLGARLPVPWAKCGVSAWGVLLQAPIALPIRWGGMGLEESVWDTWKCNGCLYKQRRNIEADSGLLRVGAN